MARRPSNPLSEHARALQEEHERILREMAETEKALRQKPKAPARTKPEPERKVRINTSVAASINLPRPTTSTAGAAAARAARPGGAKPTPASPRSNFSYSACCSPPSFFSSGRTSPVEDAALATKSADFIGSILNAARPSFTSMTWPESASS